MKKVKALILITVMLLTMFASSIVAFAEFSSVKDVLNTYAPGGTAGNTTLPSSIGKYMKYDVGDTQNGAVVYGVAYYWYDKDEEKIIKAGNKLERKETQVVNDDAAIQKLYDTTEGFAIAADIETAGQMLSGFMGVLKIVLGVIVVLASVGMTVYSGFDICYIAFPVIRNNWEESRQSGGLMASNKRTPSGERKLKFVSDDAQYAVIAADTTQSGRNPFIIYFQKRLISYLVLAILLFILLTGRVTVFTDIALKLVSGILDMIQQI